MRLPGKIRGDLVDVDSENFPPSQISLPLHESCHGSARHGLGRRGGTGERGRVLTIDAVAW